MNKMRILRYLLFAFLLLAICPNVNAQQLRKVTEKQKRQMIAAITQTSAKIRTIQCDFTQVSVLSFLEDKATAKGKMSFTAPGSLVWQYTSPTRYTFSIENGKVTTKSGGRTHSIDISNNKMYQNIVEMMMGSVSGQNLSSGRNFAVEMYVSEGEWIAFLTPLKADFKKMFKSVRLHFNKRKRMVQQVEMISNNGDSIKITLSNIQTTYRR